MTADQALNVIEVLVEQYETTPEPPAASAAPVPAEPPVTRLSDEMQARARALVSGVFGG